MRTNDDLFTTRALASHGARIDRQQQLEEAAAPVLARLQESLADDARLVDLLLTTDANDDP